MSFPVRGTWFSAETEVPSGARRSTARAPFVRHTPAKGTGPGSERRRPVLVSQTTRVSLARAPCYGAFSEVAIGEPAS